MVMTNVSLRSLRPGLNGGVWIRVCLYVYGWHRPVISLMMEKTYWRESESERGKGRGVMTTAEWEEVWTMV